MGTDSGVTLKIVGETQTKRGLVYETNFCIKKILLCEIKICADNRADIHVGFFSLPALIFNSMYNIKPGQARAGIRSEFTYAF